MLHLISTLSKKNIFKAQIPSLLMCMCRILCVCRPSAGAVKSYPMG